MSRLFMWDAVSCRTESARAGSKSNHAGLRPTVSSKAAGNAVAVADRRNEGCRAEAVCGAVSGRPRIESHTAAAPIATRHHAIAAALPGVMARKLSTSAHHCSKDSAVHNDHKVTMKTNIAVVRRPAPSASRTPACLPLTPRRAGAPASRNTLTKTPQPSADQKTKSTPLSGKGPTIQNVW